MVENTAGDCGCEIRMVPHITIPSVISKAAKEAQQGNRDGLSDPEGAHLPLSHPRLYVSDRYAWPAIE